MAVCAQLRISVQLLEHAQIPELRAIVQVRVPLAEAPEGTALSKPATADSKSCQQAIGLAHARRSTDAPHSVTDGPPNRQLRSQPDRHWRAGDHIWEKHPVD